MRLRTIASWVFASILTVVSQTGMANVILADSVADWVAAVNDGIDVNGNAVAAGSADDAAQQGHAASSNGFWNYKGTNGPSNGTFSGSPGFFTNWSNGAYVGSHTRMGASVMTPSSTQSGDTYGVREWFGEGLDGSQLLISGSFATTVNGSVPGLLNNGVEVLVLLGHFVLGSALLEPNGDTYNFDFLVNVVGPNPRLRFAVGPGGPIPTNSSITDFFIFSVQMSVTIEEVTVSEPLSIMMLLSVLGVFSARYVMLRRRAVGG